jgi:hypothetical protein
MELKGTGVIPFFMNYKYTLMAYKTPLIDNVHVQGVIVKVKELKTLYQELAINIKFIT